ncbi:flagellar export protein FliJ [Neobacillus sp. LXY-4]|uniref:flagellar export protein FliJ n=1 Tax=Neobacillus sp. LXY-4 TaxID=3379826 RepID=UPI003EDE9501
MTFTFRFENILTMKEKEKEAALNEMNTFRKSKEIAENQLQELVEKKDSLIRENQKLMERSLMITELHEREQYVCFIDKQIEKAKIKLAEVTKEFECKKGQLLAKNQEEKIWSSWREKSYEEYKERVKIEEQNLLDEMATIRYLQNKI